MQSSLADLSLLSGDKDALPEGISASNGRIEAERIDVSTKISGRVTEILVSEGDWVEAGQLVAKMESAELEAQLHQAEATVLQAEQQKLQAEALLHQRQSELTTAEAEFARVQRLAEDDFASDTRFDQQRTVFQTAQAAMAAGGTVITLTDLTDMYMSIYLPSRDAGRLAIGADARIILDAIPDYVIPATVTFVASTAQFTPKSVETQDERDQLMFRVKLTIGPDLLAQYQDRARAGVPGLGYVLVDEAADWPAKLAVRLPQ